MTELERRLLLREGFKRFAHKPAPIAAPPPKTLRFLSECFDKQAAFIQDPSREKAALCTRRAGKTTLAGKYLYAVALRQPNTLCTYWAITRLRSKQLIWDELKRIDREYGLGIEENKGFNETELTVRLKNGSQIRLLGADKAKEAEKRRGDKVTLTIIDETQLFGDYLQNLVEDIVGPALMDTLGTVCLMGTPGPVRRGFWYRVTRRHDDGGPADQPTIPGWSVHRWSVLDNPFLPHANEEIARLKHARGWRDDNPTYRREYRGEWVDDSGALFYAFDKKRNTYDGKLPELRRGETWEYALGWDIGWDDAMALVLWAYSEHDPNLYEVHSWKKSRVLIGAVADEVTRIEETYGFIRNKVADTGGGGKLTVEEMSARFHHHFEPAKKTDKAEIVRFMNSDFELGRIKVIEGSPLAQEYAVLTKDPEAPTEEDPRIPNHCADGGLYSYRRARHWQHETRDETPEVGTKEHFDNMAAELERQALAKVEESNAAEWWER